MDGVMMLDLDKFSKVLALASSSNEMEALSALRMAHSMLAAAGLDFQKVASCMRDQGQDLEHPQDMGATIVHLQGRVRHLKAENRDLRRKIDEVLVAGKGREEAAGVARWAARLHAENLQLRNQLTEQEAMMDSLSLTEAQIKAEADGQARLRGENMSLRSQLADREAMAARFMAELEAQAEASRKARAQADDIRAQLRLVERERPVTRELAIELLGVLQELRGAWGDQIDDLLSVWSGMLNVCEGVIVKDVAKDDEPVAAKPEIQQPPTPEPATPPNEQAAWGARRRPLAGIRRADVA